MIPVVYMIAILPSIAPKAVVTMLQRKDNYDNIL